MGTVPDKVYALLSLEEIVVVKEGYEHLGERPSAETAEDTGFSY